MTKEVDIQSQLITGVKQAGGWAKKASNTYISGIPDLVVVLNTISGRVLVNRTALVEIKLILAWPVRATDLMKFKHPLTELQHQCLLSIRKAGGSAGWWAIFRRARQQGDYIYVGHDKRDIPTREEFQSKCLTRQYGQKWGDLLPEMLARLF